MNTASLSRVGNTRANLQPHLPQEVSNEGNTCHELENACDDFVSQSRAGQEPGVDPYSPKLSVRQKIQISEDLSELASGVQADFEQSVGSDSALRLPQLQDSLERMGGQAQEKLDEAKSEKSELRKSYGVQVAKTMGWMVATGASLLVGLVAPVLSVPLVAVTEPVKGCETDLSFNLVSNQKLSVG